jgi:hypothetical protein
VVGVASEHLREDVAVLIDEFQTETVANDV